MVKTNNHIIEDATMENTNDLILLATNWGFEGDIFQFCEKASAAGYDGIEVWVPTDKKGSIELNDAVKKYNLKLGLLAGGHDKEFINHKKQFQASIIAGIALNPIYINCHTGKDYFLFQQNKELISYTIQQSVSSGIPIYHETHRGRSLFAGHITKSYVDDIQQLRLTLDISHWCNVHESLLADQEGMVDAALLRADHIHARVGHARSGIADGAKRPDDEPERGHVEVEPLLQRGQREEEEEQRHRDEDAPCADADVRALTIRKAPVLGPQHAWNRILGVER